MILKLMGPKDQKSIKAIIFTLLVINFVNILYFYDLS